MRGGHCREHRADWSGRDEAFFRGLRGHLRQEEGDGRTDAPQAGRQGLEDARQEECEEEMKLPSRPPRGTTESNSPPRASVSNAEPETSVDSLQHGSDEELLARFRAGVREAFGALVRRYEGELFGYL